MALILWYTALLLVSILENPASLHWLCRSSRRSGLCQTSSRSTFGPLCIWRGTLFLNVSRVEMGEITTSTLINLRRAINGSSKAATYSPEVTISPGTTFLPTLGQQSGKLVSQMWGESFDITIGFQHFTYLFSEFSCANHLYIDAHIYHISSQ